MTGVVLSITRLYHFSRVIFVSDVSYLSELIYEMSDRVSLKPVLGGCCTFH